MDELFPALNDDARIWIWIADRPLCGSEQSAISEALDRFLRDWTTHGRTIRGGATILFDQVLILAGEVTDGEISGCGIDKSAHLLQDAARELGFEWSSSLHVPVLGSESGPVKTWSRTELRREIAEGRLTSEHLVLDRTLTRLGEARASVFLRPLRETWAARYLATDSTIQGE